MQKWFKYILLTMSLCVVSIGLVFLGFSSNKQETKPEIINTNTVTTSTTLTAAESRIFGEVTNDGVISYLKITIPEVPGDIVNLKIEQHHSGYTYLQKVDETGNTCYFENKAGTAKETTFYFTRPAIYTVTYTARNIVYEYSCEFSPTINETIVKQLYTSNDGGVTKNQIVYTENGEYFFTRAGELNIPTDSLNLYKITATTKNTEKTAELTTTVEDNKYGITTYTISNTAGNYRTTLNITTLTINFDTTFKSANGATINKNNYLHLGGYVFNDKIALETVVNSATTDLLGNTLSSSEITELLSKLDFKLTETLRDSKNTQNVGVNTTTIEPENNKVSFVNDVADHSIFVLSAEIKGATDNKVYNSNITTYKIITKIPTNDDGDLIFVVVMGQIENEASRNYLSGVLNGYLKDNTTIYYPAESVRLFFNGDTTGTRLKYTANNSGLLEATKGRDFSTNNEKITVENGAASFDQFITFNFNIKTYTSSDFISKMLRNNMFYNNTTHLIDDYSDYENEIDELITNFIYNVPSDYSSTCIPMRIRVTYNGTSFDNIADLKNSDKFEFSNYGDYVIEFYNLPNYEFLMSNLASLANTNFYYRLSFKIAGPSITATTKNYNNETITLSNDMYTQRAVNLRVDIEQGQSIELYYNNTLVNTFTESIISDRDNLSNFGTYKVLIKNSEGTILRSLTFSIVDNLYQGFSISEKDSYDSLLVSKRISEMPLLYENLDSSKSYHLVDAGLYRIEINAKDTLPFSLNGVTQTSYTLNRNVLMITVQKSYFGLYFSNGGNGQRVSKAITLSGVAGVQLQSLEVYKNGKLIKTFTAEDLAEFDTQTDGARSFSDNGKYTFRLTDKFGNTYEAQVEKYYKVNVALIFLILIAVAMLILLLVIIFKSRHKIKVK